MLCYAMLCYAMLCYAMLCFALCFVLLCYVMLSKIYRKSIENLSKIDCAHTCAHLCTPGHTCAHLCTLVHTCAHLCTLVHAHMCTPVHTCAHVDAPWIFRRHSLDLQWIWSVAISLLKQCSLLPVARFVAQAKYIVLL